MSDNLEQISDDIEAELPANDEDWDVINDEDEDGEELVVKKPGGREEYFETAVGKERVILVGVTQQPQQRAYETDDHLDELEMLVETAGGEVVSKVFQKRSSINVKTFIGKGKVEILGELCKDQDVHTVVFDDDLSPGQQRNLETALETKILDRTALILDIFALHARTRESKTQVELAQLEYILPRLSGMWTHLSKQYGGMGTKGPGETQIETDRRMVRDRITHLQQNLAKISRQRETQRKSRDEETKVALVGYTNVGKSTLLNIFTDADVLAENKLFATLDSTVRAYELNGKALLLTDTVGFIRKLPTKLVASFKSTLEEVTESDIIIHVVDCSHPGYENQMTVVQDTLKELKADDKPTIVVFNKVDLLESESAMAQIQAKYPQGVLISAARGMNLGKVEQALQTILDESIARHTIKIAPPDFKLLAEFHTTAQVSGEKFEEDHILLDIEIKPEHMERLQKLYPGSITIQ
jgi:GTPase